MVLCRRISAYLVLLVTGAAFLSATPGPAGSDTTVIVVLGTVHAPSACFDLRALSGIIERVNPDLILAELDSSFFTASMTLKPEFTDISMENRAVSLYTQSHPVPIRPYDIAGRNRTYEQHNYFTLQRELSSALNSAEHDSLLGPRAASLLDAIRRFDLIGREIGSDRPEVINSNAVDAVMENKQYYGGEGMAQIVESVPALARFADFAEFKRDFWTIRNDAMVYNITARVKEFQVRTVLVLCGYEHRYYLRAALNKRSGAGRFILKEYWAY